MVSPLEHREECSKELTCSSIRAKSGIWERVGVALCKESRCVRIVHMFPRLHLHFHLVRAVRNLGGYIWDKYWLESVDVKFLMSGNMKYLKRRIDGPRHKLED